MLIDRFSGPEGVNALRDALLKQQCVSHDPEVVKQLLAVHQLVSYKPGEVLSQQGTGDTHILLILVGRVSIQVNGRELAIRSGGQHVGEMALIDTSATRSATLVALDETVAVRIEERPFTEIANGKPSVWRNLALELGNRLRERSKYVNAPNPRPVVFIGCAVEGLAIAEQIQLGLSHADVVPQVWTDNVFTAARGTMQSLERRIKTADFGVLVCTPDDRVLNDTRNVDTVAPRDNVILELGMCIGAMGSERAFLVRPRGIELKMPTDLLGITPIDYVADDPDNLAAHIGPVCTQIKQAIRNLVPR